MDVARRSADRGQLLIITAVSLAVLVVVLTLALNTAVYGEVHVAATDDGVQEERTAVQYRDSVDRGIGGLILPVNEGTEPERGPLEDALADEIGNWSETTAGMYARDGVATRASLETAHFGRSARHENETRSFTSAGGNGSWTVAEDVETVYEHEMNVTSDDLAEVDDCTARDQCFHLVVDGSAGSEWELLVYQLGGDGDIVVEIPDHDGGCQTSNSSVTMNYTDGTFVDEPACEGGFVTYHEVLQPPYRVEYVSADSASGTYELAANGTFDESNYNDAETSDSPRLAPYLVGADVRVEYRSAELNYETVVRVDPGEDDA